MGRPRKTLTPDECDTLVGELKNGICKVTFIKKNGEKRIMKCTLVEQFIPDEHLPLGDSPDSVTAEHADTYIRVYDLDKSAWRSFIFESVTKYTVLKDSAL